MAAACGASPGSGAPHPLYCSTIYSSTKKQTLYARERVAAASTVCGLRASNLIEAGAYDQAYACLDMSVHTLPRTLLACRRLLSCSGEFLLDSLRLCSCRLEEMNPRGEICRLARAAKQEKKERKRRSPWGGRVLALQKARMAKCAIGTVTVSMPAELVQLIIMSAAKPLRMIGSLSGVCQSWRSATCGMHLVVVVHHVVARMEFQDVACLSATCSTFCHMLAHVRVRVGRRAVRGAVRSAASKWLHVCVIVPWSAAGVGVQYAGVVTGVRAAGTCLCVELDERAGQNTRYHTIPVDQLYAEGSNV